MNYKLKNWDRHTKSRDIITEEEKQKIAEEITAHLSNNYDWKSHRRPINIYVLKLLKLRIEDYHYNLLF